jgi:hypothetical protein
MAKGQTYNHERIAYTDARTGVRILQLTSYPTINYCLPYTNTNFTPDSMVLIFLSRREARRDAPWDLFRVSVEGSDLTQLTESEGVSGCALSPDGAGVYFVRDGALWRVDMHSCEEEMIAPLEIAQRGAFGTVSADGRYYFTQGQTPLLNSALIRVRTDGRETVVFESPEGAGTLALHACDPGGSGLLVFRQREGRKEYHLFDDDFHDRGLFTASYDFAHCTFLGRTGRLQGCALPPDRALLTLGVGDEQPRAIARGVYFWHSASTPDGEWVVADTNWPDEGLQLVHVPTGRFRPLCYARGSQGHPQWTHPHPQFSPDGQYVLYNSDRTGICQIYLARVPEDLRERIRTGQLTAKDRLLP